MAKLFHKAQRTFQKQQITTELIQLAELIKQYFYELLITCFQTQKSKEFHI